MESEIGKGNRKALQGQQPAAGAIVDADDTGARSGVISRRGNHDHFRIGVAQRHRLPGAADAGDHAVGQVGS